MVIVRVTAEVEIVQLENGRWLAYVPGVREIRAWARTAEAAKWALGTPSREEDR